MSPNNGLKGPPTHYSPKDAPTEAHSPRPANYQQPTSTQVGKFNYAPSALYYNVLCMQRHLQKLKTNLSRIRHAPRDLKQCRLTERNTTCP
jgi:hypothetical protein